MGRKGKMVKRLVVLVVCVAMVSISATRCSSLEKAEIFSPKVLEVVMAKDVDDDRRPVEISSTFTSDSPEIYCCCKMQNVPEGSKLQWRWFLIEGNGYKNWEIDRYTWEIPFAINDATVPGGVNCFIVKEPPPKTFWVGSYRVDFYIDGKKAVSVPFKVVK